MIEFLWLGRGGQGAFTAAKLLGAAYALKGDMHYSLAFPAFGPERRGAPVRAFTKIDSRPVRDRSEIDKADYIVILDETLYSNDLQIKLKPSGKILVNSRSISGEKIVPFDGESFAKQLHLPTVNTVMLGAASAISDVISAEELIGAVDGYMPEKIRDKNKQAILRAVSEVIG